MVRNRARMLFDQQLCVWVAIYGHDVFLIALSVACSEQISSGQAVSWCRQRMKTCEAYNTTYSCWLRQSCIVFQWLDANGNRKYRRSKSTHANDTNNFGSPYGKFEWRHCTRRDPPIVQRKPKTHWHFCLRCGWRRHGWCKVTLRVKPRRRRRLW